LIDHQLRVGARRPQPPELPRTIIRLVLDEAGAPGMTKVGEQVSELLEFIPAQFIVNRYLRETWSNAGGEIVTAPPSS